MVREETSTHCEKVPEQETWQCSHANGTTLPVVVNAVALDLVYGGEQS